MDGRKIHNQNTLDIRIQISFVLRGGIDQPRYQVILSSSRLAYDYSRTVEWYTHGSIRSVLAKYFIVFYALYKQWLEMLFRTLERGRHR